LAAPRRTNRNPFMKFRQSLSILATFTFAATVLQAQDHHAKIALEDGTSLRTSPLIIPTRSGICAVINFFLDGTLIYRTARTYIMSGEKAADDCPVTIRLTGYQPQDVVLREGSLVVLKRLGEHHEGATVSKTSLDVPKAARKAYESGVAATIAKKLPAAQKHFENAVALYPRYATAWCELGELLAEQKRTDEARSAYNHAVEADPKYIRPYVEIARLELSLKRNQEAAAIADRGIAQNPMEYDPGIFFYSAVANFNLKLLEPAEKSAARAVDLDTTHKIPRAELLLGRILLVKGDPKGAAVHMRRYVALSPKASDAGEVQQMIARIGVQ
jgi:tetratricopeptide (TPR) repeat protein